MLTDLSLELLVEIALYLPTTQKFQLVLTCKRLKDAILERCLYETLVVPWQKQQTEPLVLFFRKNPSKGQQVKFLIIGLGDLSNQLLREIPLIFPNVTYFYDCSETSLPRPEETYSKFIKWKDTLKYLVCNEIENTFDLFILLEKNVFSRLTTLVTPPLIDGQSRIDLLECLKNTPALEDLCIDRYTVNLKVLETIHSRCPLLTSITIMSCIIVLSEEETLSEKIVPTLRLSRLQIFLTVICDQRCIFLAYLIQKYTKLIYVELNLRFAEDKLKLLFPDQTAVQMISNTDYIARKNELQATSKSYTTSASSILSNLPSTIRSIMILSPNIQNKWIIFSKKCVNLTNLDFLTLYHACDNILTSPEDINMFKNLPFLKYLSIVLDPSMQNYTQAPASTSIIKLKTIIKGESPLDDMDIGWLLSMFPSLTNLDIEYSGTRLVGYKNSSLKPRPALNNISIGPSATHPDLMKFICEVAPNLNNLYWWISGKVVKNELERRHPDQHIIIHPNEPKMENETSIYIIDLTGFYLNCFHLEIDLREKKRDKNGDILLELNDKYSNSEQFIISEDFKCVYFATFCSVIPKKNVKTKITIQYDYTKKVTINSKISIDLKESQLQLNYYR